MHRYAPVGQCIYCGTTEPSPGKSHLSEEHIIPLSFGGRLILPEASCDACAKIINHEIETPITKQEWGYLRANRQFPTRNKKRRPTHVKLTRHDGSTFRMPIEDYSAPTPLYLFGEARILTDLPYGTDHLRWTIKMLSVNDVEMAAKAKYPEWDGKHRVKAQAHEFARLIAKIGFSFAIAEFGIGTFDPLVTDLILGRTDDHFLYVGGSHELEPPIPDRDHTYGIRFLVKEGGMLVITDIRLFAGTSTPTYHAIVGRIDFQNPQHVVAIEKHRADGRIVEVPLKIG